MCSAKAAVDKKERADEKARTNKKGETSPPEPGMSFFPQAYTISGTDLGKFREAYYEEEAKKREAMRPAETPIAD